MASGYKFTYNNATVDLSDVYMEKQYFGDKLLWLWGDNSYGILGDNTIVSKSSPVQTVASGTNWSKIGSGYSHMAGIKTDGTLWTWGSNAFGELGDGTAIHRSSPVQTVAGGTNWTDVACGYQFTGAIKSDGTLWTFGRNSFGSLGTNSTSTRSSPLQTAAAGTNWRQVACGQWHMAAIKTDGTLWTWGRQFSGGPLGDNTQVSRSSPVQTVTGGTNWAQVACGRLHTAALKTDGTLWGFGANNRGALGTNSLDTFSSPVQTITAGTNWAQVACGFFNTLAIKTDGTLWLWGQNSEGQLGDDTLVHRSSPVQTIAGGTNWKQVATGCARHTVAIKTNGSLWVWGLNSSGQLGDTTIDNKSSPIMVSGGTWTQAALGTANTFAIKVN